MTTTPLAHRATAVAARATDLSKVYGQGETQVVALDRVTVDFRQARVHRDHGPLGLRQVHADALRGRPGQLQLPGPYASARPSSARSRTSS